MDQMVGKRDRVSNYYSVKNGKVVKDLGKTEPQVMDGVTKRVNKNGETVYEIVNDYIRGKIVKLEYKEPPPEHKNFKSQMEITLQAGSMKAVVRIPFDSAYGRGFLLCANAIDFTQEVELEPWKYTDKKSGKDKMGLSVYQHGEKLEWTMGTKNNQGDVPQLEQVKFKGELVWDNSKQLAFFEKFYAGLTQKVAELNVNDVDVQEAEYIEEEEDDDIDF